MTEVGIMERLEKKLDVLIALSQEGKACACAGAVDTSDHLGPVLIDGPPDPVPRGLVLIDGPPDPVPRGTTVPVLEEMLNACRTVSQRLGDSGPVKKLIAEMAGFEGAALKDVKVQKYLELLERLDGLLEEAD